MTLFALILTGLIGCTSTIDSDIISTANTLCINNGGVQSITSTDLGYTMVQCGDGAKYGSESVGAKMIDMGFLK